MRTEGQLKMGLRMEKYDIVFISTVRGAHVVDKINKTLRGFI